MKLFIVVLPILALGFTEGLRFPRQAGRDASTDVFFNQQPSYFDSNAHVFKRREITDDENEIIIDDINENEIIEIDDTHNDDDDNSDENEIIEIDDTNKDDDNEENDNDGDDDGTDDDDDRDDAYDDNDGWGSGGSGDHGDKAYVTTFLELSTEQTAIPKEEPKKYETGEHVCSEEYGKRCTDILSSIENMSDITEEFCINREDTEECLSNILEHCVDDEDEKKMGQQFFEMLKEALNDICQGNKESNDSSHHLFECIQNSDRLKHSTERCAEFARLGIEELKNEEENELSDEDFKCLSMHLLIECLMEIASEECGADAAKLLETRLKSEIGKELEASSSYYCAHEIDDKKRK